MLISRGGPVLRRLFAEQKKNTTQLISNGSIRSSGHWRYRMADHRHSKANLFLAEVVGGFMWWWILWHLWHEPEHITGEFPYPDPTMWTNEELGIPSDDEE